MDEQFEEFKRRTIEQAKAMLTRAYSEEEVMHYLTGEEAQEEIKDQYEMVLDKVKSGDCPQEAVLEAGPESAGYCLYMMFE